MSAEYSGYIFSTTGGVARYEVIVKSIGGLATEICLVNIHSLSAHAISALVRWARRTENCGLATLILINRYKILPKI